MRWNETPGILPWHSQYEFRICCLFKGSYTFPGSAYSEAVEATCTPSARRWLLSTCCYHEEPGLPKERPDSRSGAADMWDEPGTSELPHILVWLASQATSVMSNRLGSHPVPLAKNGAIWESIRLITVTDGETSNVHPNPWVQMVTTQNSQHLEIK